jgi:hypothetical protein
MLQRLTGFKLSDTSRSAEVLSRNLTTSGQLSGRLSSKKNERKKKKL